MKFTLEISMKNTEGVLERILCRLRQRNVSIEAIDAICTKDSSKIEARITVESKMGAEPAIKQLAKLYDIQSINVFALDIKETSKQAYYANTKAESPLTQLGELNEVCLSV